MQCNEIHGTKLIAIHRVCLEVAVGKINNLLEYVATDKHSGKQ